MTRAGKCGADRLLCGAMLIAGVVGSALAGDKLLGTGGVSQFEGAAGGGLTPWALVGGYGTREQVGLTAFSTYIKTDRYALAIGGAGVGLFDRLELTFARQNLKVGASVIASTAGALVGALTPILGPAPQGNADAARIRMDVFGAKLKIMGDAIYDQDTVLPQIAVGLQHKINRDFDSGVAVPYLGNVGIPALLGAKSKSGTDFYITATKAILGVPAGKRLLLSGTARATKANAFGLLGFGRRVVDPLTGALVDENNAYRLEWEGSAGLFLRENLLMGAEFRTQSSRLRNQPVLGLLGAPDLARENTAKDVFIAYIPNKHLAAVLAWVDLGNLPFQANSRGVYLSLQAAY